jgi:hypothetical protein
LSKRCLALNVLVGLLGCLFAVELTRELLIARPLPTPPAPHIARVAPPSAPASVGPATAGTYGVIATKNLFSPSRSEAPVGSVGMAPKPLLHGVVMDGPQSRAYLEDPVAKRTFGYAVGDSVGGGRLHSIGRDRVVVARPEGLVEVLLQDPSKPRSPPTAATAVPGAPPVAGAIPPVATPWPAAVAAPPIGPAAPGVPPSRMAPAGSTGPGAAAR